MTGCVFQINFNISPNELHITSQNNPLFRGVIFIDYQRVKFLGGSFWGVSQHCISMDYILLVISGASQNLSHFVLDSLVVGFYLPQKILPTTSNLP